MGRRMPHRKSRTGCFECKRRRIKCGEEKPNCKQCRRHDVSCVYPPLPSAPPTSSIATTPNSTSTNIHAQPMNGFSGIGSSPHPSIDTQCQSPRAVPSPSPGRDLGYVDPVLRPFPLFEMDDLALLHHWSLVASLSIHNTPAVNHIWQTILPQIAFSQPYVMYGILSLAGLHLAYLDESNRPCLLANAAYHHNKALRGLQEGIDHISNANSDALFASATLNIIYVFATFGKLCDESIDEAAARNRRSCILGQEWIPLTRGIMTLLGSVGEHVRVGPLSSLLPLDNWDKLDPSMQPSVLDVEILQLREIWAGSQDAEVYDDTLYLLRKCWSWNAQFENMQEDEIAKWGYNRSWSSPFIWLILSPNEFFLRLQLHHPQALIILAYFGALVDSLKEIWWMEGWGKNIVGAVQEQLGTYWDSWMYIPRQIVGLT